MEARAFLSLSRSQTMLVILLHLKAYHTITVFGVASDFWGTWPHVLTWFDVPCFISGSCRTGWAQYTLQFFIPGTWWFECTAYTSLGLFGLVDTCIQCACGSSVCSPSTGFDFGYRHFCHRLQGPPGVFADFKAMVLLVFSFLYKSKRIESHSSSLLCFPSSYQGKGFISSYGQYTGHDLCDQIGSWHSSVNAAVGLFHHQLNPSQSLPLSRSPEQHGRAVKQVSHQSPQDIWRYIRYEDI